MSIAADDSQRSGDMGSDNAHYIICPECTGIYTYFYIRSVNATYICLTQSAWGKWILTTRIRVSASDPKSHQVLERPRLVSTNIGIRV